MEGEEAVGAKCPVPPSWTDGTFADAGSGFDWLNKRRQDVVCVCAGVCPHHGSSGGGERGPARLLLPVQTGAA